MARPPLRPGFLSRLAAWRFGSADAAASCGTQAGARPSSSAASGGGSGAGAGSTATTQQPGVHAHSSALMQQQPVLAAMAQANKQAARPGAAQQYAGRQVLRGDPVSMNRGTLWVGGVALLVGGVALGTQADRLSKQSWQQLAQTAAPLADAGSAAAGMVQQSRQWLTDHLPSVTSHSQARAIGSSGSGNAHSSSSSAAAAALDLQRSVAAAPLGGCLSPFFISDAAAKAAPAVVNITVQASNIHTGHAAVGSSGSGFIVDPDGTILTNAHVVADAIQRNYFGSVLGSGGGGNSSSGGNGSSGSGGGGSTGSAGASSNSSNNSSSRGITITLQDGRIFEGRLVSYDSVSDLAVLKVESDAPLPTVKLGRSAALRVGEWVVALGSPLHLQNSVTAGIISCVDRKAVELGLAGARTDYIQTDAAINRGNSGGPLVNLFGEVIGISAMKAVAADGVSFAIPVDTAVDVMRALREHGRVIRPYVGIKMLQLNRHNAAQFKKRDANFPSVQAGILVPGVHPGSPAERAGLRPGDVIVGFGDRNQEVTPKELIKALGAHVGKPLTLRVVRPGDVVATLTVVALEASEPPLSHLH